MDGVLGQRGYEELDPLDLLGPDQSTLLDRGADDRAGRPSLAAHGHGAGTGEVIDALSDDAGLPQDHVGVGSLPAAADQVLEPGVEQEKAQR